MVMMHTSFCDGKIDLVYGVTHSFYPNETDVWIEERNRPGS